jgi:hypothetical protein
VKLAVLIAGASLAVAPALTMTGQASAQTTSSPSPSAVAGIEEQAANGFVQIVQRENGHFIDKNPIGVNTPAIMATEAHYEELWAQDVAEALGN